MKRSALAALAVAGSFALAGSLAPAAAQDTGTFTLTQNGNQIATESFTRTADRLETQLDVTGQGIMASTSTLGADATVSRVELRVLPPGDPDADPLQSTAADFQGDSVHFEEPIGTEMGSVAASEGTVPYLNPSPSYMEQIVRRARAMGGSEVTVQIWIPGPGGGQVVPAQVAFADAGTTLTLGQATVEIETDDEGRLLSAEVPAQSLVIERQ